MEEHRNNRDMLQDLRCLTKNTFVHFEDAANQAQRRGRCFSDVTDLRWETGALVPKMDPLREGPRDPLREEGARDVCSTRTPSPRSTPREDSPRGVQGIPREDSLQDLGSNSPKERKTRKGRRRLQRKPALDGVTVMLRNIPNKYTRQHLLDHFAEHHIDMDFFYLPSDFNNNFCNLGYAFVNFLTAEGRERFTAAFEGASLPQFQKSPKVLQIDPARIQGLSANVKRLQNSSIMGVLPEEMQPVLFADGEQAPFPKPRGDVPPVGPRYKRGRGARRA